MLIAVTVMSHGMSGQNAEQNFTFNVKAISDSGSVSLISLDCTE